MVIADRPDTGSGTFYDGGVRLSVAVVQLDATDDVERNIQVAVAWPMRRRKALASWCCPSTSSTAVQIQGSASPPARSRGQTRSRLRTLPNDVTPGSWQAASLRPPRIRCGPTTRRHLIVPDGSVAATYRKIHLFDVAVDRGPVDTESARVTAGDRVVTSSVDGAIVGLSICYDLRFAELYRSLALAGAQILLVPANFTERTGRDHWEVLL